LLESKELLENARGSRFSEKTTYRVHLLPERSKMVLILAHFNSHDFDPAAGLQENHEVNGGSRQCHEQSYPTDGVRQSVAATGSCGQVDSFFHLAPRRIRISNRLPK
jgi:hypothetical protein